MQPTVISAGRRSPGLAAPSERKTLKWLNCGHGTTVNVIATSEVMFFQSRNKYTAHR